MTSPEAAPESVSAGSRHPRTAAGRALHAAWHLERDDYEVDLVTKEAIGVCYDSIPAAMGGNGQCDRLDMILAIEAEAAAGTALDVERLLRVIHNTECGYASHITGEDGVDPDPCGFRAGIIAAEYARLAGQSASDQEADERDTLLSQPDGKVRP